MAWMTKNLYRYLATLTLFWWSIGQQILDTQQGVVNSSSHFLYIFYTASWINLVYATNSLVCLAQFPEKHLIYTKLKGTHHVVSGLSCWSSDENMDTKIIHVSWVAPWLQVPYVIQVGSMPTETHKHTTLLHYGRLHVNFPTQPRLYMKQIIDTKAPEND